MSLLALEVYTMSELIHCLGVRRLPEMNAENPGVSQLSQCQNRSARKGVKLGTLFGGNDFKNEVLKCEEDEIKGFNSGTGSSEIY